MGSATVLIQGKPAARMGEYLQVVAATFATLRGRRTPFEGTHLRVTRPAPYAVPDPDRPAPPVLLAAVGPRMTQVAATHADGLVGHPLTSRAHLEQVVVPRVDAALAAAGRPRAAFTLVGGLIVDVDDDVAAARRRARRQVAFYGSTPNYAEVFAVTGDPDLATRCREHLRTHGIARLHEAVPDEALDRYAVAGSAADVRAGVARWRPLVDHLVVTPATVGRPPEEVAAATEAIIDALAPADPEVA